MIGRRYAVGAVLLLVAAVLAASAQAATPAENCAAAQTLAKAAPDQARRALTAAILGGEPCPKGVKALTPSSPPPGTMKRVEDWIAAWSKVVGALVGAVLVGLVLLVALFALATHSHGVRRTLRHVWVVGRFLQPSVSLEDFSGDDNGKAVGAVVGLALRRMRSDADSVGLDVVTGTEGFGETVAKLGDVAPQFKSLGAILTFVASTAAWPRYKLSGALAADAGRGPGLTLALNRKQRAVDGTGLWRKPADETDVRKEAALQTLALVAAGWTEWAVRTDELPTSFEYEATPLSYGYLRAGAVLEYFGRKEEATAAYRQAVTEDETNVGALTNLGRILGRHPGPSDDAEALLKAAMLVLEPHS